MQTPDLEGTGGAPQAAPRGGTLQTTRRRRRVKHKQPPPPRALARAAAVVAEAVVAGRQDLVDLVLRRQLRPDHRARGARRAGARRGRRRQRQVAADEALRLGRRARRGARRGGRLGGRAPRRHYWRRHYWRRRRRRRDHLGLRVGREHLHGDDGGLRLGRLCGRRGLRRRRLWRRGRRLLPLFCRRRRLLLLSRRWRRIGVVKVERRRRRRRRQHRRFRHVDRRAERRRRDAQAVVARPQALLRVGQVVQRREPRERDRRRGAVGGGRVLGKQGHLIGQAVQREHAHRARALLDAVHEPPRQPRLQLPAVPRGGGRPQQRARRVAPVHEEHEVDERLLEQPPVRGVRVGGRRLALEAVEVGRLDLHDAELRQLLEYARAARLQRGVEQVDDGGARGQVGGGHARGVLGAADVRRRGRPFCFKYLDWFGFRFGFG